MEIAKRDVGLPDLYQMGVQKAEDLPGKGETVAQVALAKGFADPSQLTRSFSGTCR